MGLFIELFQLEEELSRKPSFQPSLEDGLIILKEAADFMKDVERQAYFRTGRRCPQGPDLALSKPTRDAFKMLHSLFEKTNSFFSENDLQHIAKDICFPSFTTLHVEHFFAGMRTPSRPTPDMHDYGSRRPSCIVESVQKVYHSSFSVYTGPRCQVVSPHCLVAPGYVAPTEVTSPQHRSCVAPTSKLRRPNAQLRLSSKSL